MCFKKLPSGLRICINLPYIQQEKKKKSAMGISGYKYSNCFNLEKLNLKWENTEAIFEAYILSSCTNLFLF